MQGKRLGQDDFGGHRFQLAYMTHAMALAHTHRRPAAPGLFESLLEKAIAKMLHPEVCIYWKDTTRGGAVFNATTKANIVSARFDLIDHGGDHITNDRYAATHISMFFGFTLQNRVPASHGRTL